MQFTMAPMNLCCPGSPWTSAHGNVDRESDRELEERRLHNIAPPRKLKNSALPRKDEIQFQRTLYVLICTNNHHRGDAVERPAGKGGVPLVADMSSDLASRAIDVDKYGVNRPAEESRPSDVTVVIIRKDLAERADRNLTVLQYRTQH